MMKYANCKRCGARSEGHKYCIDCREKGLTSNIEKYNQPNPMKYLFISHPFADNPPLRKKQIDKICKHYNEQGYIIISPLHMFGYVEQETPKIREKIMETCFDMIEYVKHKNGEILFVTYDYGLSKGQAREYTYCFEKNYEMEFVSGDEFVG